MVKCLFKVTLLCICCFSGLVKCIVAQSVNIVNHAASKTISLGNKKIQIELDYNHKVNINSLKINGQQVIKGDSGVYAAIATNDAFYSTLRLIKEPTIKISNNKIEIKKIVYGSKKNRVEEEWQFTVSENDIQFQIKRRLSKGMVLQKVSFPVFTFNLDSWEGAYQDYGGLAWFYLFNKRLDAYGVHSKSSRFWNSITGNGLTLSIDADNSAIALDYNRTATDKLSCNIAMSSGEFIPRFDSGTNRRRYVRDTTAWVWSPLIHYKRKTTQTITLSYFDFEEKFGRGKLVGINQKQLSAVLNTIARIGVIDRKHFGGNSWHTPYGPICLHEQYIGEMGLAINDPFYLEGYKECLDNYRDNAIKPDGRVWPRWAYSNEDAMPGGFNNKGFYEAQWGYLLDSNPDLVANVSDLYNQNGDIDWVKTHQQSCERALDWIISRDQNNNGLVEMITDSTSQKRGSDWIDIIWAAYENAFVNAKLYHALVQWAGIEKQLGNTQRENDYKAFAQKLKASFNASTKQGGFWDEEKQCYVHWRDKDGSIHGRNMVTPVNFMAIAYGICDDETRKKTILDNIETQMQKEDLFFWPLCMYSYAPGEGNDWQFPFPAYENGDIFLSWGSVAVKAYASYKPALALKYINRVLNQYAKDGLAFQRYGRAKQDGLGDDILSGNSLAAVGLYQSIYGINPLYNRFYLNPHITKELAGTQVRYNFRGQQLLIDLEENRYAVSNGQFKITAAEDFGYFVNDNGLFYFDGNADKAALQITAAAHCELAIEIKNWQPGEMSIVQMYKSAASDKLTYSLNKLKPDSYYTISINNNILTRTKSDASGSLQFEYTPTANQDKIVILNK